MESKDNNFDLFRHLAAFVVMWGHSFSLSLDGGDPLARLGITGAWGVNLFFCMSGWLITASWLNRSCLKSFAIARAMRIMPALTLCVLTCALLLGPLVTTYDLKRYFFDWYFRGFIVGNITMLWPVEQLPGVFLTNPHPRVINGSLWTLPPEATMYGFVAVLGAVGRMLNLRNQSTLLFIGFLALFVLCQWSFDVRELNEGSIHSSRLFRYFCVGALLQVVSRTLTDQAQYQALTLPVIAIVSGVLVAVASSLELRGFRAWCVPWLFGATALWLATSVRMPRITSRWTVDCSYGLYIYSYPVQQTFVFLLLGVSGYQLFATSFVTTLVISYASWCFLERPALRLSTKLRSMASGSIQ